jgi:uncharacterized protein YcbX
MKDLRCLLGFHRPDLSKMFADTGGPRLQADDGVMMRLVAPCVRCGVKVTDLTGADKAAFMAAYAQWKDRTR